MTIEEIGARVVLIGIREARLQALDFAKSVDAIGKATVTTAATVKAASAEMTLAQQRAATASQEYAAVKTAVADKVGAAAQTESAEVRAALLAEVEQMKLTERAAMVHSRAMAAQFRAASLQSAASASAFASAAGGGHAKAMKGVAALGKNTLFAGLLVGAGAAKLAGDFQQQTNVLMTAAGETQSGLGVVRRGIRSIAVETGTSFKELEAGAYLLAKANYHGADAMHVLRAAAQGAREENASLGAVTNAMTSVMASYHYGPGKAVQVMNALKTGAGQAKTTMEEFAASLSIVIPIASAVGISVDQVFGALGTLTQHGTSAQEGTQELGATIRGLTVMNRPQMTELQQLGLNPQSITSNLGKRGITGTLKVINSAILGHMTGPNRSVVMSAFNKSQSAVQDRQMMLDNLPANLRALAEQHMNGQITAGGWRGALKGLPVNQASLLGQFATLDNKAQGFNKFLRSGDPAAQSYVGALGRSMGTGIGLNTALQLIGPENMPATERRAAAVHKSLTNPGKDVEGWGSTMHLFNVSIDRVKMAAESLAITLGNKLIPAIMQIGHDGMVAIRFLQRHKTLTEGLALAIGTVLTAAMAHYVLGLAKTVLMSAKGFAKMAIDAGLWAVRMAASWIIAMGPIGWIALGVAAVGVALYVAWQKSETFRNIVIGVFKFIGRAALDFAKFLYDALTWPYKKLFEFLASFPNPVQGMAKRALKSLNSVDQGANELQRTLSRLGQGVVIPISVSVAMANGGKLSGSALAAANQAVGNRRIGGQLSAANARAGGGAVHAGMPYWVGERGPELFVPTVSGGIRPAGSDGFSMPMRVSRSTEPQPARGARSGVTIQGDLHLHANGVTSPAELVRIVKTGLADELALR